MVCEKFGHTHADDQEQSGEPGKETQHQEQAAEQLREDHQRQAEAMSEVHRVGKNILEVTEIFELIEAVIKTNDQAKSHTEGEYSDVEGAFGIGG